MNIQIRAYQSKDAASAAQIWNEVVTDGNAFPQDTEMTANVANLFFRNRLIPVLQKCGHSRNSWSLYPSSLIMLEDVGTSVMPAMLSVKNIRGLHIGEKLVLDCLQKAKENQFRILQFNAVVATNTPALHLYERIGFKNSAQYPAVSGCQMELMKTSFHITIFSKYIPSITEEGRIQLIPDAPCIYDQLFTKYLYRAGGTFL